MVFAARKNYNVAACIMEESKKIKVVHIITRFIKGGAQENTFYTMRGLRQDGGFDVIFVTGPQSGPEGSMLEDARNAGIEPVVCEDLVRQINFFKDIKAFAFIYRLVKKQKPDIVHTHSSKAGILGRLAAYFAGCGVIVHTIHGLPFHPYQNRLVNWLYATCEKIAAFFCQKIIVVADAMAQKAADKHVAPASKFITIPSGIELDAFTGAGRDEGFRRALDIPPDSVLVVKIARLFDLKGYEYYLEAARRICAKTKDAYFLAVGGGALEEELKKQVDSWGLSNRIKFTGLVPRGAIPGIIASSDVVCHCSLREGLARVMPQAMACAKPLVGFDVDGASEVIENGATGWLVKPRDMDGLESALMSLIKDPSLRKSMGEKGRQRVAPRFEVNYMVKEIARLYNVLIYEHHH